MQRRVIVVTGAAGGIGRPLVEALAAAGHTVVATDLQMPAISAAAACLRLDVRDASEWSHVVQDVERRLGPIDVLFNVAGYARAGYFADLEPDEISRHLDVNLQGAALGMRSVLPGMVERGAGHIVNVGSLAAAAAVPGIALYSATKFALRGLSLAVAREVAESGVEVTLVHPDLVDTPMIDHQRKMPEAAYSFSGGRILSAREVALCLAGPVLEDRPLEMFLPAGRGLLCRLVGSFPRVGALLAPVLRRRGLARQAQMS